MLVAAAKQHDEGAAERQKLVLRRRRLGLLGARRPHEFMKGTAYHPRWTSGAAADGSSATVGGLQAESKNKGIGGGAFQEQCTETMSCRGAGAHCGAHKFNGCPSRSIAEG